jgi:DNA-binding LacI/PurR family transcriptional regulator
MRNSVSDHRAATLEDVAARAGVSKGAAAVVLLGSRSNTRVSAATRERLLASAAELNYTPNDVARSLSRRSTNIMGVYFGGKPLYAQSPFDAAILDGLNGACGLNRKDLLILGSFHSGSENETYAKLVNRQIDALVMLSQRKDTLTDRLAASHLPVITVVNSVPDLPCVGVDDAQGARLQAEHLYEKGHRRVLYRLMALTLSPDIATSVTRRLQAFQGAARELGMTVHTVRENHLDYSPRDSNLLLTPCEREVLTAPPGERPTAVVCWSDYSAYCFFTYCENVGIRVPDDLAIVGFDGVRIAERWGSNRCTITSIKAPWEQVGEKAVELVLSQRDGVDIPHETLLPVTLQAGGTT